MRSMTHPQDDLRLADQRGVELQRIASEQRLLSQHRADRRAARMEAIGAVVPTWRRRVLAATAVVTIALSIGAVSSQVDAAPDFAPDDERTVSSCDHLDGYRPACSMLTGRPDGWFQP